MESTRPNRRRAEESLAIACLQYLNHFMKQDDDADGLLLPPDLAKNHSLKTYVHEFWFSHIQRLERTAHDSTSSTAVSWMLKLFLGSPGESSKNYREWQRTGALLSLSESNFCFMSELRPATHSVLAMARLGIYYLVRDLWDDATLDVEVANEEGYNLLSLAAMSKSVPVCRLLVARGLKANSLVGPEDGLCSALAAAAHYGSVDTAKFLVEGAGATIELPLSRGQYGSALATAASQGYLEVVKYLVGKKPEAVNQVLRHGRYGSALAAAARLGRQEMIKFLIRKGANVNERLLHGNYGSALIAAMMPGNNSTAELIEHGADVNQEAVRGSFGSALAAAAGIEPMVRLLVEKGDADVNQVLHSGVYPTALFAAIVCEDHSSFLYLVSKGANVESILQSDISASALAAIMCSENLELLEDLEKDGTTDMRRVVQEAILVPRLGVALQDSESVTESAKALIRAGADVNTPMWSSRYGSCLEICATLEDADKINFLVDECGASVNSINARGIFGCALSAAAGHDESVAVELLLRKGADLNLQARQGMLGTPLQVAAFAGRYECVKVMLDVEDANLSTALKAAEAPKPDKKDLDAAWWNLDGRTRKELQRDRAKVKILIQARQAGREAIS